MRLESIKVDICKSSLTKLREIQSEKSKVEERYKLFSELRKDMRDGSEIDDILKCCNKDIKTLERLERKVNGYKKIIIEKDGDYDRNIIRIIFPKGTKMKFKKDWLKRNDYPIKTEHYKISSAYDCTGEIHTVYVNHKANVVEIESLYDV